MISKYFLACYDLEIHPYFLRLRNFWEKGMCALPRVPFSVQGEVKSVINLPVFLLLINRR